VNKSTAFTVGVGFIRPVFIAGPMNRTPVFTRAGPSYGKRKFLYNLFNWL